jgi:carboxypeptidase Q
VSFVVDVLHRNEPELSDSRFKSQIGNCKSTIASCTSSFAPRTSNFVDRTSYFELSSLSLFPDFISNAPRMLNRSRNVVVLLFLTAVAFAAPDSASDRLISESLNSPTIESNLRKLTDEIGGRVPGTPAMQRAVQWGMNAFRAAGADSVTTEEFTMPASWSEGATAFSVTALGKAKIPQQSALPVSQFKVRAVSIAWAPALAQVHHVPIVDVGEGSAADFAKAGDLKGKMLLVHSKVLQTWPDLFQEYMRAPPIIDAAVKGRAVAIAFMSSREHDILYRHCNSGHGEIDRIPQVLIAREDGERVARLLASGLPVFADLSIPNKIGGPLKATNVVAELKGADKSDEIVILGAHLDSWELGTGALDNGCDSALVIDALRAIKASGLRPRRTIRFILFSGEEEGMVGSNAYVKDHRAELDKIAGVVIFDSGTGHVTGFSVGGRKDVVDAVSPMVASLQQFDAARLTTDVEWGTDNFDFMLEGVPTFVANNEEGNYLVNYHASSDTFDKVDLPQLKKQAAEAATLTLALANSSDRVGPRLTRAQIEQTLIENHADEQLKALGMWEEWQSGARGRQK